MVVLCMDISLENFNSKHCNVYKYEVLGGLHFLLAKQQLPEAYPDNLFYKVTMAEIYVALSDEQCLWLAQWHNINSHFVHHITHHDLVSVYRILVRVHLKAQLQCCIFNTNYYEYQPCIHSCSILQEPFRITTIFNRLSHVG